MMSDEGLRGHADILSMQYWMYCQKREISYRWCTCRSASAVAVPDIRMYFWAVARSLHPMSACKGTGATPLYAW